TNTKELNKAERVMEVLKEGKGRKVCNTKNPCLRPLHDPHEGALRVVGLMSGKGSNLQKILEWGETLRKKRGRAVYQLVAIFSDTFDSSACEIGKNFDIPVVSRDVKGFYAYRGKPRSDLKVREEFDRQTVNALSPFEARVAVYAGYMSIATQPLVEAFLGVNVHPADLSIEVEGKRKYTGSHAVRDAIAAGETSLCSTTHMVESIVDEGRILMISSPLPIAPEWSLKGPQSGRTIAAVAQDCQERLKMAGDWIIFPRTLQYIAEGRYALDEDGNLFFDGQKIPHGLRLDPASLSD
ncbi:MAG: formyltransferase family protein, partial [bacterium]